MFKKVTSTEEFIEEASRVHNNYYDYSEAVFVNMSSKIRIICPEHGPIEHPVYNHLEGRKPWCCTKVSKNEYLDRFYKAHGDKYDYSKAVFSGCEDKIEIGCKEHGSFWQTPVAHWKQKQGCPKCAHERSGKWKISNTEAFVEKAVKVHGRRYDYSKVEYHRSSQKVEIVCNNCKESFYQRPNLHLKGQGCRHCNLGGFTHSKPAHLYVLDGTDGVVKVGITNKSPKDRINQIFNSSGKEFKFKHSFLFDSGKAASLVENIILADFRVKYNQPAYKFSGYSECFVGVTSEEAVDEIRKTMAVLDYYGYFEIESCCGDFSTIKEI